MKLTLSIIFLGVFFISSPAQRSWSIEGKSIMELRYEEQNVIPSIPGKIAFQIEKKLPLSTDGIVFRDKMATPPAVPSAYQYDELGIFCKWEVQMEKAARIPVKFRLGEVQYVEKMEGKLK